VSPNKINSHQRIVLTNVKKTLSIKNRKEKKKKNEMRKKKDYDEHFTLFFTSTKGTQ